MNTSDLVAPRHLNRLAKIYVRQSSPHQVIHNTESQRMQYALHDRALGLGWHDNDIAIVDADLGISGASTEHRVGYQDLIAEIALGNVGILQVDLVFQTMLQKKTIAATTRWFRESDLMLPRRDVHGRIQWKRSTSIRSQGSGRYSCDAQRRKSDAEVCQRTASERIDKQAGAPLGT